MVDGSGDDGAKTWTKGEVWKLFTQSSPGFGNGHGVGQNGRVATNRPCFEHIDQGLTEGAFAGGAPDAQRRVASPTSIY